jgi:hypothetical protein
MTISERLYAVRQIEHENGDTTWIPVDLDTFTEDDQFQVFNTFTGEHEYYGNIAEAKARWDDLKQQIIAAFVEVTPIPPPTLYMEV